jgi:hypothetical protein
VTVRIFDLELVGPVEILRRASDVRAVCRNSANNTSASSTPIQTQVPGWPCSPSDHFRKANMQNEQLLERLAPLKKEFETGQARLRELEAEIAYVRETMLRISGAIQVLEELTGESKPDSPKVAATR